MLVFTRSLSLPMFVLYVFISILLVGCGGGGGGESSPTEEVLTLSSLSLSEVEETLKVSETVQLTLTGLYSDASTQELTTDITWSVLDDDIVSLSETGLVTALSAGTTSVTASYAERSVSGTISVKALADLSISPSSLTLAIDSQQQLGVTGRYTDNTTVSFDQQVDWSSENVAIATVSETGEVRAVSAGTVAISASASGITSSVLNVTVSPATLQSIMVTAAVNELASGLSTTVSASGLYSDGSEQSLNGQVTWQLSDTSKASIDETTGLFTAIQAGSTSVIATLGELTGSLTIEVSPATLTGIAVTPSRLSLAEGVSAEVNVTAIFSDNSKQNVSDQVSWLNTDSDVAQVDNGAFVVRGLSEGQAMLTANLSGEQASLTVDVTGAELVSLALSPINATIPLGLSQQYTAQGTYTDGSVQDLSSEVTWLTSNESVALISNNASLKGLAETQALGSATISAVLGDIEQQTSLGVDDAVLNSLEIQPANQTVANGTEAPITALGYYSDGSVVDVTSRALWNTTSADVVDIVSANEGVVASLAEGAALISAELDDISALANISVTAATLESIAIQLDNTNLPSGMRQQLSAVGTFSDASTRDISQQVTWQSSNVALATVSNAIGEAGLLRAVQTGEVSISATLGVVVAQVSVDITDAVLTSLSITLPEAEMNVKTTQQARVSAVYSDSSTQDVTAQVDWLSSNSEIASIGNNQSDKGRVSALSIGTVNLSASLNGVVSDSVALAVTLNPNLPNSLKLTAQPNVLLNNASDTALITITLVPTESSGVIPDGTPVTLTITEGETSRGESLFSTDGQVSYELQSSYDGLISLSATTENLSVSSAVLSTDQLKDAILANGQALADFDAGVLKAGSSIYLFLRNLSNRVFTIRQVDIVYVDPDTSTVLAFPESPLTEPQFISGGTLSAGEFTYVGYGLDEDVRASIYVVSYLFYDPVSDTEFRLEGGFNFSD